MSDLINREDAIKLFLERKNELAGIQGNLGGAMSGAAKLIESLPPAEPKKGKWTNAYDGNDGHVKCTACFRTYDYITQAQHFNYCPNCGARMEVTE